MREGLGHLGKLRPIFTWASLLQSLIIMCTKNWRSTTTKHKTSLQYQRTVPDLKILWIVWEYFCKDAVYRWKQKPCFSQ